MLLSKVSFRAITLPILIFLFSCLQLHASDTVTPDSIANDFQRQQALQFRIGENLSLGSFLGGNISVLFGLSSHTSLRLGVGLTINGEGWDKEVDGDTRRDEAQDYQGLNLQAHYLVSPKSSGKSRLYFGGGPWLNLSWSNRIDKSSEDHSSERRILYWLAGAKGIIGYSWQLGQRLGLFAEYYTLFSYRRQEERYITRHNIFGEQEIVDTYEKWGMEPGGALLGVSLYF